MNSVGLRLKDKKKKRAQKEGNDSHLKKNEALLFVTIWMGLWGIMLSEINQRKAKIV